MATGAAGRTHSDDHDDGGGGWDAADIFTMTLPGVWWPMPRDAENRPETLTRR